MCYAQGCVIALHIGTQRCGKDDLRSDSPCVNIEVFRMILSFAVENSWTLGKMDIKKAFLQAKGFDRNVYEIPPREARDSSRLWKVLATEYGLVNSGRPWYRTSDQDIVSENHLTRSRFETTICFLHANGKWKFILVAQVDKYI